MKGSPFIVRTERVKELQRQLHHLGLEPGMVDGRYGPLTTEAVKQFQEAHNLPADGIADPETLSQIKHNTPTTPERELSQTQEYQQDLAKGQPVARATPSGHGTTLAACPRCSFAEG